MLGALDTLGLPELKQNDQVVLALENAEMLDVNCFEDITRDDPPPTAAAGAAGSARETAPACEVRSVETNTFQRHTFERAASMWCVVKSA